MKKLHFLFFSFLFFSFTLRAQVRWTGDIIIDQSNQQDLRDPKVMYAYNGWVYACCKYTNGADAGYNLYRSMDGGLTWANIGGYDYTGVSLTALDFTVVGGSTSSLDIWVINAVRNTANNNNFIYLDKFDGDGNYLFSQHTETYNNTVGYLDAAIDNDYYYPSYGITSYSIGACFAKRDTYDSLIYVNSSDAGATWSRVPQFSTLSYMKNCDISYGRSYNNDAGRYWMVWDVFPNSSLITGDVYGTWDYGSPSFAGNTPYLISDVNGTSMDKAKNPKVSCSFTDVDNSQTSFSVFVTMETRYSATDHDVVSYLNDAGNTLNNWTFYTDPAYTTSYEMQGDASYDSTYRNFLFTYFDSTLHQLNYYVHNWENSGSWINVKDQFNDDLTGLVHPDPQVAIDYTQAMVGCNWIHEGNTGKGELYFDAEYLFGTVVHEISPLNYSMSVFPNPASNLITAGIFLEKNSDVIIRLVNSTGQTIRSEVHQLVKGLNDVSISLQELPADNYWIYVGNESFSTSKQVVVVH